MSVVGTAGVSTESYKRLSANKKQEYSKYEDALKKNKELIKKLKSEIRGLQFQLNKL